MSIKPTQGPAGVRAATPAPFRPEVINCLIGELKPTEGWFQGLRAQDRFLLVLGNIDKDAELQARNLSAAPGASWDQPVKLPFTIDDKTGYAIVSLPLAEAEAKGLGAGDVLDVRQVTDGGPSMETRFKAPAAGNILRVDADELPLMPSVHLNASRTGKALTINDDGYGIKPGKYLFTSAADERPPGAEVSALKATAVEGGVVLDGLRVEPYAAVAVTSASTGLTSVFAADREGHVPLLSVRGKAGDRLTVDVYDQKDYRDRPAGNRVNVGEVVVTGAPVAGPLAQVEPEQVAPSPFSATLEDASGAESALRAARGDLERQLRAAGLSFALREARVETFVLNEQGVHFLKLFVPPNVQVPDLLQAANLLRRTLDDAGFANVQLQFDPHPAPDTARPLL